MSPAGPKRSGGGAMHLEIVRMQATQSEEKVDGLTQGMKQPLVRVDLTPGQTEDQSGQP